MADDDNAADRRLGASKRKKTSATHHRSGGWTVARMGDQTGDTYFALRTYRRDSSPVVTPIWLAPARGRWYGYTPSRSWKVRRIRRDPRVEFAQSTFDGEPTGSWQAGTARVLPAAELRTAKRALSAKYGNRFRFFTLVLLLGSPRGHGGRAVGIEITPN